jgi:hypothetical protein
VERKTGRLFVRNKQKQTIRMEERVRCEKGQKWKREACYSVLSLTAQGQLPPYVLIVEFCKVTTIITS